jgi:hypothetical protein
MAKFDLKKAILENKATFYSSLTEGQFSWFTQDTNQQIGSEDENTLPFVYMHDNKGNKWLEKRYEGYGEFGGKDYYELLDQMNGGSGDRSEGIRLAFDDAAVSAGKILFPALTVSATLPRSYDFTEESPNDPNQSWYTPEEDDDDDDYIMGDREDDLEDDEEELNEGKMYFHVLEDGGYGDIGHQGVYNTKEEAQNKADKLADMFPASSFYVEASDSKDEPYNVTMEENKKLDKSKLEEGLTPLQQYVYDFESDISGEDFAEEEKENIMNLKTVGDVKKYYTDYRGWMDDSSLREMLMDLLMDLSSEFPKLKEGSNKSEVKEAMMDVAKDMTTQETAGIAERFAKYMSNKEGYNFTVTAGSVEGPSFDLDVDGQEYEGGSYVILTNGDIVNMALPGNPVYGNTLMMDEAEKPKTKMKKSEFKDKIKEMVLAEMESNNMEDAPESEVDFLAEVDRILAEADEEEVAVDDTEVSVDTPEDDIETTDVTTTATVDPNVKAVQDALTQAQAAAQTLGDAKLTDQIGNTITFFTRSHVVDKGAVAEADETTLSNLQYVLDWWEELPFEKKKEIFHQSHEAEDAAGKYKMEEGKKEYYNDAESDDAAHINALEKDMKDDKDSSMKIKEVVFPMWQRIK